MKPRKNYVRPFIRVGLVDDHKVYIQALELAFSFQKEFSVLFTLNCGSHLLQYLNRYQIDILLLDIRMREKDGFVLLKEVKQWYPSVKVIMVSFHRTESVIVRSYQMGANGYVSKNDSFDELKQAIREVYRKGFFLSDMGSEAALNNIRSHADCEDLVNTGISFSETEKKIIYYSAQGYENKKLAKQISLKINSLTTYKKRLIKKARCKNMNEVIAFAINNKVIVLP